MVPVSLRIGLIVAVAAAPAAAQLLYGGLVGTVTDANGAVVPGAKVTIVNTDTSLTRETTTEKLKGLVIAGVALAFAGLLLQWLHINPIIKRIWTSSYTLYSGGLVILILAGLYALIEWKGWKRWSFPLLVIGANSIAIYVMSWTMEQFVSSALVRHLGSAPFAIFGQPFEPVLRGLGVLIVFWLILFWMYRRKIFLRI